MEIRATHAATHVANGVGLFNAGGQLVHLPRILLLHDRLPVFGGAQAATRVLQLLSQGAHFGRLKRRRRRRRPAVVRHHVLKGLQKLVQVQLAVAAAG